MKHIRSILFILFTLLFIVTSFSCSTVRYVYLPGETKIEYRDTTVYKDSLIYTPVEVVKEIVPAMDTLKMETSMAEAEAYVDTTLNVLKGSIKNKKGIEKEIHYKDRIVYRDSIITKPYPVEVEVEKIVKTHFWYEKLLWFFSIIGLGCIIITAIKLYAKFKVKI